MKTLKDIKDEVAKEIGYKNADQFIQLRYSPIIEKRHFINEVCRRAQLECARETLKAIKKKGINVIYTGDPIQYAEADLKPLSDEGNIKLIQ